MSLRYPGGLITKNPVVPSTSSAAGIWTLEQALEYIKAGTWPTTSDPYFEYVTLLLHGNGTNGAQNNTFLDSSTNAFTITRNGNATQGTFSPFSRADGGFSNYFDGDGDYLTWAGTTLSGNFTVECWVYKTAVDGSGYTNVFYGGGNDQFGIDQTTAGSISLTLAAITVISASGTAVTPNTWHHLAWVREGTTCRAYVNGVQQGTGTSSASFTLSTIGRYGLGGYEMNGYISNVRITNACLYPSGTTFTPSTTPFTTTVSTGTVQLLTCQSNRFIDNSTNAFTITQNGNVSVQAFGPFNPTTVYSTTANGGSGYFDGFGDYLNLTPTSALNQNEGDWTYEMFVYPTSMAALSAISSCGVYLSQYFGLYAIQTNGSLLVEMGSGSWSASAAYTSTAGAVRLNSWNHIAFVRSSGTFNMYANGVRVFTQASATFNPAFSAGTFFIGTYFNQNYSFNGYMSGFRFVKGTALYSGTTYTVPTAPPTAITNTSLLLNFTNGGIFDNAAMNNLETVGNAQISTAQSKFGGGSMYFDGTGDRLQGRATPEVTFGTGDFTVEGWLYLNSVSALQMIFDQRPASTNGAYPLLYMNGAAMTWYVSSADRIASSSLSTGTWYHFAVSRSGTSTKMFINGTQAGSTYTDSTNYLASNLYIGASAFDGGGVLNGYIDDFRITKGYARYTANFTPPTAPFADK